MIAASLCLAGTELMAGMLTFVSVFEAEKLLLWWLYVQYEIFESQFLYEMFLRFLLTLYVTNIFIM